MPVPPEEVENGENSSGEEPKLQFSPVECLLFSFHQLGKKLPDFLLDKVDAEKLKDFKIRSETESEDLEFTLGLGLVQICVQCVSPVRAGTNTNE